MKKHIWLFLALFMTAALPAAINAGETGPGPAPEKETKALLRTTHGVIEIRFFPETAPKHVENFIRLAKEGFYDGTIFHMAVPGLMILGGDPYTKVSQNTYTGCCPDKRLYGMGGPAWTVPAEFSKTPHKRGIVSMARFKDPDSAGSQFFIVLKDSPFLDGKYSVFGEVASGMEVADKIAGLPRDKYNLPKERVEMKVTLAQ